jgi:hypothetical protein
VAEDIVRGDEEPGIAAARENCFAKTFACATVSNVQCTVFGLQASPVSRAVEAPVFTITL